jgi:maltose alpha-D-glucosyltransferase / alpha-amylase
VRSVPRRAPAPHPPTGKPASAASLWYKDAVIYELHVRTFHDSDADGIGDFAGLTAKLDYLEELGVTAIWLLPFYPSPLRDDGYDIADYTDVHADYGTLDDFKRFLREAHRRGLRVITELVLNHTSDAHPWFERARHAAAGSPARDFYVWSDTPKTYKDARVIFQDFESSNWTWDPVAGAYYWHRFYSHQPDLNYRNPAVIQAIARVLDFWLRLGVDGVRLDAVPYLVEAEGTVSENLPETHAVLKRLRRHVDERFADRMLLAEANQWPEDAVAYFGDGDECHMAFHFPLMPRLFMGIRQENRFPIVDVLAQTPAIPETCQWALFLRNHDELTLEMVTEEERLFMYRAYTRDPQARINLGIRRRLAPLLGRDRRKIELMNALLLSLPGTPILYYGDEIGMGDNIFLGDRNGIRTPMQWTGDRNSGFSTADPQRLCLPLIVDYDYHHQTVHVEAQQRNRHSLLSWMKRLIKLRKRYRAFGRGTLEFRHPANLSVLAFIRRWEKETMLVVANLSRFDQHVELDLSGLEGLVPVEVSGRNPFPVIGDRPYPLTLAPYGFLWLALEPAPRLDANPTGRARAIGSVVVLESWESVVAGRDRSALEEYLPDYLRSRPWFTQRARRILSASIVDAIALDGRPSPSFIVLVRVDYADREPDTYVLPLAWATGERAAAVERDSADRIVARVVVASAEGIVYDAIADPDCADTLLRTITGREPVKRAGGDLVPLRTAAFRRGLLPSRSAAGVDVLAEEQSNSTIRYGDLVVLKLLRSVDEGMHPELAIGDFLTRRRFAHAPTVLGALEYRPPRRPPVVLAILQRFVPNDGDAWTYTLEALKSFERDVRDRPLPAVPPTPSLEALLKAASEDVPAEVAERLGGYLPAVRRLGQRTGELHSALGAAAAPSELAPEAFTMLYQRSLYQSLRGLTRTVIESLRERASGLPAALRADAERVVAAEDRVLARCRRLLARRLASLRIACHGNYHLLQVLRTEDDFVLIDFEGEPLRPLFERRLKRSPLVDIASMVRSFHYAAGVALPDEASGPGAGQWSRFWTHWVSVAFIRAYLSTVDHRLLPADHDDMRALLEIHLLERTLYELGYELTDRPDWIHLPLRDLRQTIDAW